MASFGLINLDAAKVEPLAIIAVAALAGWWLYSTIQAKQATAAAAQSAADQQNYDTYGAGYSSDFTQQAADVALLNSLMGGGTTNTTATNSSQPTYTAPSSTTGTTTTTNTVAGTGTTVSTQPLTVIDGIGNPNAQSTAPVSTANSG